MVLAVFQAMWQYCRYTYTHVHYSSKGDFSYPFIMPSNVPQRKWPINILSLFTVRNIRNVKTLNVFTLQEVLHVVIRLGFIRVLTESTYFLGLTFFYVLTVGVEICCYTSHTHWHTHTCAVGLLSMRDRPVSETCTWQHTTFTSDTHPFSLRDSNQKSQQASDQKSTS